MYSSALLIYFSLLISKLSQLSLFIKLLYSPIIYKFLFLLSLPSSFVLELRLVLGFFSSKFLLFTALFILLYPKFSDFFFQNTFTKTIAFIIRISMSITGGVAITHAIIIKENRIDFGKGSLM